ncbi:MAG TPA: response regulator, partial [bacterium]|nr:response regulator [bacterium]
MEKLVEVLKGIDGNLLINDKSYKKQISEELKSAGERISEEYGNIKQLVSNMPLLLKSNESFFIDLFNESRKDILLILKDEKITKKADKELSIINEKLSLFISELVNISEDDGGGADQKPANLQGNSEDFDYSEYEYALQDFIDEMKIMIESLENDLLNLENADLAKVNQIFRCMHTIKGAVGMFKLTSMEKLVHKAENIFDKVRHNELELKPEYEDVFLKCVDRLKELLVRVEKRENPIINVDDLIVQIEALEKGGSLEEKSEKIIEPRKEDKGGAAAMQETKKSEVKQESGSIDKSGEGLDKESMSSLRVDISKLDNLMNQMGELIIEKIKLEQQSFVSKSFYLDIKQIKQEFNKKEIDSIRRKELVLKFLEKFEKFNESFLNVVDEMTRSTMNMQESVMKIRLVPLATIFNRFNRLMRDISKKVNKKINFTIEGAETEIDKGICEMLFNPLLHILRNSVDHGIEASEADRIKANKNPVGNVTLKAYYKSDKVVIDIIDDGRGIDSDKIIAKAIEKKLVTPEEAKTMDEKSKLMMIFQPGFSTAEVVTDISGRGVGMDVVRSTIEKLKGTVDIQTEKGQGSTISLSLPLTLAIVRILLFKLKNDELAIPVYNVRETVQIPVKDIFIANHKPMINLRGEVIPLIYLTDVFNVAEDYSNYELLSIIIAEVMDKRYGLVVTKFIENREVVIKNIGTLIKKAPFISGAAILGDGEIVKILDIVEIMKTASQKATKTGKKQKEEKIKKTDKSSDSKEAAAAEKSEKQKDIEKHILVVEDSKLHLKPIVELLRAKGYNVDVTENSKIALEKVKQKKYDLISTDIVMPVMDGYEFVKKLRKMKEYELTPVVALTSQGQRVDRIKGFEAGIDEYLTKPLNAENY